MASIKAKNRRSEGFQKNGGTEVLGVVFDLVASSEQ